MRADLHVHSTASDGTLTAAELVQMARERDVGVLAIADHDSVASVASAIAVAPVGLVIVPAVELSAVADGRDIHVLGYWVDHTDDRFLARLADMREARLRRAGAILDALRGAGYELDLQDVLALADGGAVGRSHIARALVAGGHADDIADAFDRLIGRGRPFYVQKDVRSPAGAIEVIRDAGGVAVLAHPGVTQVDDLIDELVAAGLVGLEAYHADHTPEQRDRYSRLAFDLGLLATGGTDFHGPSAPNPSLGTVDVPAHDVERLLEARPLP